MAATRIGPVRWLASVAMLIVLAAASALPAHAAWPDVIWNHLRQSLGLTSSAATSPLDFLAAFIMARPHPLKGAAVLAAHAGAEGHWTFLNRRGETFTVGTPDEMKRVVHTLAPDAAETGPLTLYLSDATVFERAALLAELPAGADLHLVAGAQSYPLIRVGTGVSLKLYAALRPRLHVEIGARDLFDEALAQLAWRLDRRLIRVLSLEDGGPETLPRSPRPDAVTGRVPTDAIAPTKLPAALSALRGQTAVVSGRIAGEFLVFRPAGGGEQTILYRDLTAAAAQAGVDLLIVQSPAPHQPGARNWLWQRFQIDGLDKALDEASLADALTTLAGGRGPVTVAVTRQGTDRVVLRAGPPDASTGDGIGGLLQEVTASITGSVVPTAIIAHLASAGHRRELSLRLLPMMPSSWQAVYAGCLVLGLSGIGVARRWWAVLWPPEQRAEYAGAAGYHAARFAKLAAFLALFLPLAGLPAVIATVFGRFMRPARGTEAR